MPDLKGKKVCKREEERERKRYAEGERKGA